MKESKLQQESTALAQMTSFIRTTVFAHLSANCCKADKPYRVDSSCSNLPLAYCQIEGLLDGRHRIRRNMRRLVFLVTIVQPSTLRISQETSTVHEAGYSVEQENTQLNLATLSISSDTYALRMSLSKPE
jgi:hypothetical protein